MSIVTTVTPQQIAALKYLICWSRPETPLSRRVLMFLLDQSEGMTRSIRLTLVAGEGYTAEQIGEAALGINNMQSRNSTTHLNEVVCATGSECQFTVRVGGPDSADIHPIRYTFWLARGFYPESASPVAATREDLEQINLVRLNPYSLT